MKAWEEKNKKNEEEITNKIANIELIRFKSEYVSPTHSDKDEKEVDEEEEKDVEVLQIPEDNKEEQKKVENDAIVKKEFNIGRW